MAMDSHVDPDHLAWRKSSYSGGNGGQCVETAATGTGMAVRHSKDPAGPVLVFSHTDWTAFVRGVRAGEFDR